MRSAPDNETPEKNANGKPSYAINEDDGKPGKGGPKLCH